MIGKMPKNRVTSVTATIDVELHYCPFQTKFSGHRPTAAAYP